MTVTGLSGFTGGYHIEFQDGLTLTFGTDTKFNADRNGRFRGDAYLSADYHQYLLDMRVGKFTIQCGDVPCPARAGMCPPDKQTATHHGGLTMTKMFLALGHYCHGDHRNGLRCRGSADANPDTRPGGLHFGC